MKKTILAFAAVMLASSAAHAESDFDGIVVGGDVTYNMSETDSPKSDENNFEGGVYVGYGTTIGKIYLGGEGDVTVGGFDHSEEGLETSSDWSVGATAKVGYVVTPSILAYGLAGIDYADGKVDRKSESFTGVKYGIGAETFVTEDVTVRGEVTRTEWDVKKGRDVTDTKATVGVGYRF